MLFKDISFPAPEENLLFDDVLLYMAEQGLSEQVLRIWESPVLFIVLGRMGKVEDDVKQEAIRKDKIPVLRRSSGGGTVVQGPGCLNFSLVLSKKTNTQLADITKSYKAILTRILSVMDRLKCEAVFQPVSDLALQSNLKKFSGNAQKRARNYILHHGTFLYDFDLNLIEQYLKIPKDTPAYRQNRSHSNFVTNVPFKAGQIKQSFKEEFSCDAFSETVSVQEKKILNEFLQTHVDQMILS